MVESLLKLLTKRRSQALYKLIDVQSVTNAKDNSACFFNHMEYCEFVR